jgi:hypothetical protein
LIALLDSCPLSKCPVSVQGASGYHFFFFLAADKSSSQVGVNFLPIHAQQAPWIWTCYTTSAHHPVLFSLHIIYDCLTAPHTSNVPHLHLFLSIFLSIFFRALRFRAGLARGCDEHSGWPRKLEQQASPGESAWKAHSPLLPALACLFACLFACLPCLSLCLPLTKGSRLGRIGQLPYASCVLAVTRLPPPPTSPATHPPTHPAGRSCLPPSG